MARRLSPYSLRKRKTIFLSWMLAGGSPAATHFLCFAKESKQRKATARRCPAGTRESNTPSGKRNELAALRHVSLLYPLDTSLSRQRLKRGHVKKKRRLFDVHPMRSIAWSADLVLTLMLTLTLTLMLMLMLTLMLTFNPWQSATKGTVTTD